MYTFYSKIFTPTHKNHFWLIFEQFLQKNECTYKIHKKLPPETFCQELTKISDRSGLYETDKMCWEALEDVQDEYLAAADCEVFEL